jgi:hypothetical protein
LPPPNDCKDFKALLRWSVEHGVGRPVDKDGFPTGPWTPALLADEIARIDPKGAGVELRTVQHWFQYNDKGININNVRWLARVFGCDDPIATREWQKELVASQSLLKAKRQELQKSDKGNDKLEAPSRLADIPSTVSVVDHSYDGAQFARRSILVRISADLFSGHPLNLSSLVFAGSVGLGFMSYFLGIHDISIAGLDSTLKQVGFLWAPNWTLLFMVFMPLFFAFVVDLLHFWQEEGRPTLLAQGNRTAPIDNWAATLESLSYTFWAVFLTCILFAGVFQWVNVRLLPLLHGVEKGATDWGSLAIQRPDIISVPQAIVFTAVAYLYMCLCFYLFFAGLIFLYRIGHDLSKTQAGLINTAEIATHEKVNEIGIIVICGIYRCAVLGLLIAICMKLQGAYLKSSAENFTSWLGTDLMAILNGMPAADGLSGRIPLNSFTSLVIVMATGFVFLSGIFFVRAGRKFQRSLSMMLASVAFLIVSYLLIGAFVGFSALLFSAVALAIYGLLNPAFGRLRVFAAEGDGNVL